MHGKRDDAPRGAEPSQDTQDPSRTGSPADPGAGSAAVAADASAGAGVSPEGASTSEPLKADECAKTDPGARIASLEAELAELSDRHLRKVADLENYRKRMAREMEDLRLYANTEILLDLVSLLDDFDRAIQSSETGKDWKSLHDGVIMIQRAFLTKLEGRYGLKRFDSAGEAFDPGRHEALMAEKRDDVEFPVVAEDFLKGYVLHGRVIRPAKVKVAMPADEPPAGDVAPDTEKPNA
jgi:molecular chaperone GrpE